MEINPTTQQQSIMYQAIITMQSGSVIQETYKEPYDFPAALKKFADAIKAFPDFDDVKTATFYYICKKSLCTEKFALIDLDARNGNFSSPCVYLGEDESPLDISK